jgi:tRNA-binding EMAP/Myf-like protein
MKIATIENIHSITKHPNADSLALAKVLGYQVIIGLDSFKEGENVVFIQPDTLLPEEPWAEIFRKRSSRVKACKLRGEWSFGIALPLSTWADKVDILSKLNVGVEIGDFLGITKWEPPMPQDLSAAGVLPRGIPKTDEERCVSGDTVISTNIGDIKIQDLLELSEYELVKLKVLSYNTSLDECQYEPLLSFNCEEGLNEWVMIELEDGTKLECTENHRIYLTELGCYRRADELKIGDVLLKY